MGAILDWACRLTMCRKLSHSMRVTARMRALINSHTRTHKLAHTCKHISDEPSYSCPMFMNVFASLMLLWKMTREFSGILRASGSRLRLGTAAAAGRWRWRAAAPHDVERHSASLSSSAFWHLQSHHLAAAWQCKGWCQERVQRIFELE